MRSALASAPRRVWCRVLPWLAHSCSAPSIGTCAGCTHARVELSTHRHDRCTHMAVSTPQSLPNHHGPQLSARNAHLPCRAGEVECCHKEVHSARLPTEHLHTVKLSRHTKDRTCSAISRRASLGCRFCSRPPNGFVISWRALSCLRVLQNCNNSNVLAHRSLRSSLAMTPGRSNGSRTTKKGDECVDNGPLPAF